MAGDIEIAAKVFGTKQLVAGLDELQKLMRLRIFGGLKTLAREYAEAVATSGLAEQGIKTRTGRLARSFVVRGKLTDAAARVLVYPNATDPKRKYRYPWALGQGSPKNEITVRAHFRRLEATAKRPAAGAYNSRKRRLYSERQSKTLAASGAVQVVSHERKVNMRPRPFMGGAAFARTESSFGPRMEEIIRQAIADAQRVVAAQAAEFDGAGVG